MSILHDFVALLFAAGSAMTGPAQEATTWGEAVQGAQLRLAVSDGPLPVHAGLLSLEAQLRNRGADSVTFIGEAIIHSEIEIDGVWYVQAWAGSCCSAPREIPPGGKSEVFSLRVLPPQTFTLGAAPTRALDLKPGTHSIRIRTASHEKIHVRLGSSPVTLTSNVVSVDIAKTER